MKSISYAITVCNELEEVKKLLEILRKNIRRGEDEICVLLDKPKACHKLVDLLYSYSSADVISLKESTFKGDFSDWKNQVTDMCTKEYIFQIDADEIPEVNLLHSLPNILRTNDVDIILVPRVNIVEGITQEHIKRWGWRVDDQNRINWPDYQWRIYRNIPEIKWINKVHERLEGYSTYAVLPSDNSIELFSLRHVKQIHRQELQNDYYSSIV